MNLDLARFLISPDGERLLDAAASLQGSLLSRITTLRKKYPADLTGAAIEMCSLRERARHKFSRADRMFFTREALEQASSETIATYRAERFPKDGRILDLACGIGGDTIGLALRCLVTAVDNDPVRLEMARANVDAYGLSDRVRFVCADVTEIPLVADAAFLDPSRRIEGRRVTHLSQLSPPVEFIHELTAAIPNSAVKLSPATDYEELESLGGEIEFVSEAGECKEALVWFGDFRSASRRATILPAREDIAFETVPPVEVREPGAFLYEPDPAVIRAHLVEQLAHRMGAWKLDEQIAYLTSDELAETPFAAAYRVLDSLPFNLKEINRRLNGMDAGRITVKKRGVAFEPREIEGRLKVNGSRQLVLVLTRVGDKPHALICAPAGSSERPVEQ